MMLYSGPLLAVGTGVESKPPARPVNPAEAQAFAEQLDYVINTVVDNYIRQVLQENLAAAALEGLYEAARIPVPRSLKTDVHQAIRDQKLPALIAQIRNSLGNQESLKGYQGLLVSLRAMSRLLDPYSGLASGEDLLRNRPISHQGIVVYVGLEWIKNLGGGPLRIKAVAPGGPAQKAGIRPGDQITHINGKPAEQATAIQILLRANLGQPILAVENRGNSVELTLRRPGTKIPRRVALEPQAFRPESVLGVIRRADNSWDFLVNRENKIAQVRISSFSYGTTEELGKVLGSLQAEGLRGLILESKRTDDWEVLPDPGFECRISPDLDRQLREWWLWQTLRPGTPREALPLDDPVGDPQRQAVIQFLVK